MLTTNELLDRAKAQHGIASDYKLAQVVGVAKSAIQNYRVGRSHPDDRVAARLAELTGEDAGEIAAWMQVERARDDDARAMWRGVAERLHRAGLAAAVILSLGFWTGGPDGGALASPAAPAAAAALLGSVYYVNLHPCSAETFGNRIRPACGCGPGHNADHEQ